MIENPLVSVVVITYNSSQYILECLNSISDQTYHNLELIVSDDCSTDKTVEICRKWIDEHKTRFIRAEILTVEINTGVSINCNRGHEACRGEWIKLIAGDDMLLPNCISDYIQLVWNNPSMKYVFARIEPFGKDKKIVEHYRSGNVFNYDVFNKTTEEQLKAFVFDDNHIPAPTVFYNRLFDDKRGIKFDIRLPFIEDEPKWINLLKSGVHLYFLDKPTVKYRVGEVGALSSSFRHVASPKQFDSLCRFFFYYKFPDRYKRDPEKTIETMMHIINYYYRAAFDSESGVDVSYSIEFRAFKKIYRMKSLIKKSMIIFKFSNIVKRFRRQKN